MTDLSQMSAPPRRWTWPLGVVVMALLAGCQGVVGGSSGGAGSGGGNTTGNPTPGSAGSGTPGTAGTGPTGAAGATGSAGSGVTGTAGSGPGACSGDVNVAPKRMVRLSFNQVMSSIRSLLGAAAADKVLTNPTYASALVDAKHRWFPPLANPREGSVVIDAVWQTGDQIAQDISKYVFDNFATVTKCTSATDSCAQTWLRSLAASAFRRPLTTAETTAFNQLYTDLKDTTKVGVTIQQATQFGVYAILESPQFLYRTEFGTSATAAGALTPYELASELSYFLTDGPPDAQLLSAAAGNMLSTVDQITAHVNRILATTDARTNLESAMFGYFAIPNIEAVVIDTKTFPKWNDGLRNSMEHESDLFLHDVLWNGKVNDLLTSRTSKINTTLAAFYGISGFPPAGATLDADGFGTISLPGARAGILTQGGFLVARARPQAGSVVGRGLLVNAAILCASNPAFPSDLASTIDQVSAMQAADTERSKADYRGKTSPCSACHPNFDPYGMALENFDGIGGYRTVDDMNRPIDAQVKLPPQAGGATVNGAVEMATALAASGAFANCVTKNLLNFALAETATPLATNACAIRNVSDQFTASSDGSFTALVRGIALSQTLATRLAGGAK